MRIRGNKISIQYKRTTISTGYPNTPIGWKMANEWWSLKLKELQEISDGTRPLEDSIKNIFNKFLDYKRKVTKITKKTEQYYLTGFNAIITEPNLVLSEANIKFQIENYVRNTTVSANSVNIYLRAIAGFLNWASSDGKNYIPQKDYTKFFRQKETKEIKSAFSQSEYEA